MFRFLVILLFSYFERFIVSDGEIDRNMVLGLQKTFVYGRGRGSSVSSVVLDKNESMNETV